MLDVLLESRAHRTRRVSGAVTSALVHGVLISASVAIAHPTRTAVKPPPVHPDSVIYVDPRAASPRTGGGRSVSADPRPPVLRAPEVTLPEGPVVDVGVPPAADAMPCYGCTGVTASGPALTSGVPLGASSIAGVVDERDVDRAPRVLGRSIEPRYPGALREVGMQGNVVVQFVVDTLGRADVGTLQIVQSPHPSFTESVREVLGRYRFAPGEVGGRRVPTRVQIAFEFRLENGR